MSEISVPVLEYEKDLALMKYRILISSRHDAIISELARMSGVSKQIIRSALIHRADMMLLEAIPPRYNAYLHAKKEREEEALYIFSHIIPILTVREQTATSSISEILTQAAMI
jgi:hypothetical protein